MLETEQKIKLSEILTFPFLFVLLLWLIQYTGWKFNLDLSSYALFPQTIKGLRGILFAPLLHSDFYHLFSNSVPLLILGSMMMYFYKDVAIRVFFLIYFASEAAVWFFARPSYHLGASGLVYGLVCFLFVSGIIRRNVRLMGLSLLVTFLYGGIVWGILPLPTGISWETHLTGALAGIASAFMFRKIGTQATRYEWENDSEDEEFGFYENVQENVPSENIQPHLHIHYHYKDQEEKDNSNPDLTSDPRQPE